MNTKACAHIAGAKQGIVSHNTRENFSNSVVFIDENNEYSHTTQQAYSIYTKELGIRSKMYNDRVGQKLQKNVLTHLSMVVNLLQHHSLDNLKEIITFLEQQLDTVVFQAVIHRDEGKLVEKSTGIELYSGFKFFKHPQNHKLYYDKEYMREIDLSQYMIVKNYHAHIEMLGLDSIGASIKRNKMNKHFLRELQDFVAKSLNMTRGQKNNAYTEEEIKLIESKLKGKELYNNEKEYKNAYNRIAKELGISKYKRKRYDTHDFKRIGTASQELNQGYYINFEHKDKELQKQIKRMQEDNKKLNSMIVKLKVELSDKKKVFQVQLNKQNVELLEAEDTIYEQNKEINSLEAQNKYLEGYAETADMQKYEFERQILYLGGKNQELELEKEELLKEKEQKNILQAKLSEIEKMFNKYIPKEYHQITEPREKFHLFLKYLDSKLEYFLHEVKINPKKLDEIITDDFIEYKELLDEDIMYYEEMWESEDKNQYEVEYEYEYEDEIKEEYVEEEADIYPGLRP